MSANKSVAKAAEIIEKYHYKGITHNASFIDYNTVPLGQCRELLGQLDGTGCYALYDKVLMSILLTLGTFTLATTFKVSSAHPPRGFRCSDDAQ